MASVFCDSFDTTQTFLQKWSSGGGNYNTNPEFVRSGTQSFQPQPVGFGSIPRINFANRTVLIVGAAYYGQTTTGGQLWGFFNNSAGQEYGGLIPLGDGSIRLEDYNGNPLIDSAPGVLSANKFFYIEEKVNLVSGSTGSCEVRVNGQTVLTYTGTGMAEPGNDGADGFLLQGSLILNVYFDDFYLIDDTGGVNDDFLGAVQVFAIYPDEDETPLEFTPLTGSNFSEVNQAPPPGDASYVSGATPGLIDQYHYTISGPVGAYVIKFLQHSLCCKLDAAGSHTVGSRINSTTLDTVQVGSNSVGSDYAYAIFPWDTNPNTGMPFAPVDFSTTFLGPVITA